MEHELPAPEALDGGRFAILATDRKADDGEGVTWLEGLAMGGRGQNTADQEQEQGAKAGAAGHVGLSCGPAGKAIWRSRDLLVKKP